jgi:hypothetical protein
VPGGSTDADALNLTAIERLAPGYCAYIYIDVGTIFAIFGYILSPDEKKQARRARLAQGQGDSDVGSVAGCSGRRRAAGPRRRR